VHLGARGLAPPSFITSLRHWLSDSWHSQLAVAAVLDPPHDEKVLFFSVHRHLAQPLMPNLPYHPRPCKSFPVCTDPQIRNGSPELLLAQAVPPKRCDIFGGAILVVSMRRHGMRRRCFVRRNMLPRQHGPARLRFSRLRTDSESSAAVRLGRRLPPARRSFQLEITAPSRPPALSSSRRRPGGFKEY
jgi:hypothetical protein